MFSFPQFFRSLRNKGFTLTELLVVIGVILILISIAVPNFINVVKKAKKTQAKTSLISIKTAVAAYHDDTRQWPRSGSENLYYVLTGISPYDKKDNKKYNPPYIELRSDEIAGENYETEFNNPAKTRDIGLQWTGSPTQPLEPVPYALLNTPINRPVEVRWRPVLDPWGRPIIYVSPEDLQSDLDDRQNGRSRQNHWVPFISLSSDTVGSAKNNNLARLPYGLKSGQFYSFGEDGITARGNETDFNFQPGNLVEEFNVNIRNPISTDDVNSWGN